MSYATGAGGAMPTPPPDDGLPDSVEIYDGDVVAHDGTEPPPKVVATDAAAEAATKEWLAKLKDKSLTGRALLLQQLGVMIDITAMACGASDTMPVLPHPAGTERIPGAVRAINRVAPRLRQASPIVLAGVDLEQVNHAHDRLEVVNEGLQILAGGVTQLTALQTQLETYLDGTLHIVHGRAAGITEASSALERGLSPVGDLVSGSAYKAVQTRKKLSKLRAAVAEETTKELLAKQPPSPEPTHPAPANPDAATSTVSTTNRRGTGRG